MIDITHEAISPAVRLFFNPTTISFFGCILVEFGLAIYQKRKFLIRNVVAFYFVGGGIHCAFMTFPDFW